MKRGFYSNDENWGERMSAVNAGNPALSPAVIL